MKRVHFKLALTAIMSCMCVLAFAQTLEDGKKMLYYERYQSAVSILDKLANGNPEASYYLSQAYLEMDKINEAKAVLQKANANDPLVMVGLGQIDLRENRVADAKMKFQTARTLTKDKNKTVLNAIAHAIVDTKAGDAQEGVDILKAALMNETKNPEYFVTLGDLYRKLTDGSNAVISFQKALEIQPKYAAALYKIGRVYETQGNKEVFLEKYSEAATTDPSYAPVLYRLYTYWYTINVIKATEYFDLYKKVADQGPALEYEEASLLYASKKFEEAIARARQLLAAEGAQADIRLYKLLAYSSYQIGDSVTAKSAFEIYFAKENPDKIVGDNYITYAKTLAKFKGSEDQAAIYFDKAIEADSTVSLKVDYLKQMANMFKAAGRQDQYCNTLSRILSTSRIIYKTDLYYAMLCRFQQQSFSSSDSLAALYSARWPNEIFGHYYQAMSRWKIDSNMTMAMANPHWMRYIEVASKDTVANKRGLTTAYYYFVGYYVNVANNKDSALVYATRMFNLDTTNTQAKDFIRALTPRAGQPAKPGKARGKSAAVTPKKQMVRKPAEA